MEQLLAQILEAIVDLKKMMIWSIQPKSLQQSLRHIQRRSISCADGALLKPLKKAQDISSQEDRLTDFWKYLMALISQMNLMFWPP